MVSYDDLPEDPLERRTEIDRRIEAAIAKSLQRRRIFVRSAAAAVVALVLVLAALVLHRLSHPEITPDDRIAAAAAARGRGDLAAAVGELDAALAQDPSRLGAQRLRAELALALGDGAGAREHLRRASVDGRGPLVRLGLLRADLLDRRFEAAATAAAAELARSPSEDLEVVLAQADAGAGRLGEAREVLERLLSRLPRQVDALRASAYLHLATGDLTAAGAEIDALASQDDDIPVELLRGELALARNNPRVARSAFTQVTERRPRHPEGWLGIARAALLAGDPGAALEALSKLALTPEPPVVTYLRARAAQLRGDPGGALHAAQTVLQARPEHLDARYLVAQVSFARSDLAAAEGALRPLVAAGHDREAAELLARTLVAAGRATEASRLLESVRAGSAPLDSLDGTAPAAHPPPSPRRPLQRCAVVVSTCEECLFVRRCR